MIELGHDIIGDIHAAIEREGCRGGSVLRPIPKNQIGRIRVCVGEVLEPS